MGVMALLSLGVATLGGALLLHDGFKPLYTLLLIAGIGFSIHCSLLAIDVVIVTWPRKKHAAPRDKRPSR